MELVDTPDLKSVDYNNRAGSSPARPTMYVPNCVTEEESNYLRNICEKQTWHFSAGISGNLEVSDNIFLLDSLPETKKKLESAVNSVCTNKCRTIQSWATRMNYGQEGHIHIHKGYYVTSILYLQDDNELLVHNPKKQAFELVKAPKNCLLVLPANLKHKVPHYNQNNTRYSIVMNMKLLQSSC